MGAWGFASDENDHTWDEMPTLDENDESRLVEYTPSIDSRYGGVWRRNLATSVISKFQNILFISVTFDTFQLEISSLNF